MANPSVKNGYIAIANELADKFSSVNITGQEWRIIWSLLRKTWGWKDGKRRKDQDWISISQFQRTTNMKRANVHKSLQSLLAKRLIVQTNNLYKFNQNYEQWLLVKRLTVSQKANTSVSQKANKTVSQKATPIYTKENKETPTKENTRCLSNSFFDTLWNQYPKQVGKKAAYRHFKASVKTEQDKVDIVTALNNYKKSDRVNRGFIKDGSSWFNNWQDWIDFKEEREGASTQKDTDKNESNYGLSAWDK